MRLIFCVYVSNLSAHYTSLPIFRLFYRGSEAGRRARVECSGLNQHNSGTDQRNLAESNGGAERDGRSSTCWSGAVDLSMADEAFCKDKRSVSRWAIKHYCPTFALIFFSPSTVCPVKTDIVK